jgi:hypothetical protein
VTELHYLPDLRYGYPGRMHRNCLGQHDGAVRSAWFVEDGSRDPVDMLWIGDRIDLDDPAVDDCEASRSSWSIRHIVSSRGVIEVTSQTLRM